MYRWIVYNCYIGWVDVVLAAPQAKALVFGRTAAEARGKAVFWCLSERTCMLNGPEMFSAAAILRVISLVSCCDRPQRFRH